MLVKEAYAKCKEVIDAHSKTFSKAFQHLPRKKRQAVWAIYAFCRRADDIVDEGENPEVELKQFKREFLLFLEGTRPSEDFLWIALEDTFMNFDFNHQPFTDMIIGQEMDLIKSSYDNLEELLTYSYHVASTVGLMLLPVLAEKKYEQLKESAIYLGYAMQLTNILRDIGEDLERNRIYLPADRMDSSGYSIEFLYEHKVNTSFIQLWESIADVADYYYGKGLEKIDIYPVEARLPVKAAAYFYRQILQVVRRKNYDVFKQKVAVSKDEKIMLLEVIKSEIAGSKSFP